MFLIYWAIGRFIEMFDTDFIGYMNDYEELDKIVDCLCQSPELRGTYIIKGVFKLTSEDCNYIATQVFNRTGKVICVQN
jgi:hypothetical protein